MCTLPALVALFGASVSAGLVQPAAASQTSGESSLERDLIDASLQTTPVQIVSMTPSDFVGRTRDGKLVRLPLHDVIALVPPLSDAPARAMRVTRAGLPTGLRSLTPVQATDDGVLLLRDGQVLAGTLAREPGELVKLPAFQEALPWQSRSLGLVLVPLEDVVAASLRSREVMPPLGVSTDSVLLRNNDIASGFVDTRFEPGDRGLTVLVETDGGVRRIADRRVAGIYLSNPAERAGGAWVWMSDGSTLRTTALMLNNELGATLTPMVPDQLTPEQTPSPVPQGEVDAPEHDGRAQPRALALDARSLIAFAPQRERIVALSMLAYEASATDSSRRWTIPPTVGDALMAPLGASDVVLPGPMSVTWTLPPGVLRAAGVVDLPPGARVWGDCIVTLTDGQGKSLWSSRLHGQAPQASFNVTLKEQTKTLTLRVDAGNNGAIEDRVRLRRGLLLVHPPEGKPAPTNAPSATPVPAPRG